MSKHFHGPKPLRSSAYPRGLPHLQGLDLLKVQKANQIYSNVFVCLLAAISKGVGVIVENPRNSYLWEIPEYSSLLGMGMFDIDFQHCKWTTNEDCRPKWTRLRTNIQELKQLQGPCLLDHKHIGWGILPNGSFATSVESEYPWGMCRAMVGCIKQYLEPKGFVAVIPKQLQTLEDIKGHKKRRVSSTNQPRGRKVPDLVSEFKCIMKLPADTPESEWHRVLRQDIERGVVEDEGTPKDVCFPVAGIYRTPAEFVMAAQEVSHPADLQGILPDCICEALATLLTSQPDEIIRKQLMSLRAMTKLLEDTKNDHLERSKLWDSHTIQLMKGKNLTAFEKLLQKYPDEFKDTTLVTEMYNGFSLVGIEPYKYAFDYDPVIPTSSVQQLQSTSLMNNAALLSRTKTSGDDETDRKLWELALEEKANGWLIGPVDEGAELLEYTDQQLPHVSRRFPLVQGEKLRPIDDFAESGVNLCHGRCDKLFLMDVDYVAALLRALEIVIFKEQPNLVSETGKLYPVDQVGDTEQIKFLGKTIDLKSAYKQLFVKREDRWASCIAVYNPNTNRPSLFCQVTLPFGAAASVLHFNRVARAIWLLGAKELLLPWVNFFDDYPIIYPQKLVVSCKHAVTLFFKLIGWYISDDPKKSVEFAEHFVALGVSFTVGSWSSSVSYVANLESRVQRVSEFIMEIVEKKRITAKQSETLRGKLQYMDSQVFGRIGKSLMKPLYDSSVFKDELDDWSVTLLKELEQWLRNSKPRLVSPPPKGPTFLMFTDGASEYMEGALDLSVGAVLFVKHSAWSQVLSSKVPEEHVRIWQELELNSKLRVNKAKDKQQFITEAELSAVLVGLLTWRNIMAMHRVIIFVDSDPAKFSIIRGTSESISCANIVRNIHMVISSESLHVWVTRVPTKSNPADDPSRGRPEQTVKLFGSEIINPIWST
jgi:hypothetical protein